MIQELLTSDRYMQQQMTWIAQCTRKTELRNALLFASLERVLDTQAIAQYQDRQAMDKQQALRMREKISYHAVRVFTLKREPELVSNWLET